MKDASFWIEKLALNSHPEGGFYKETYRSSGLLTPESLILNTITGTRNISTAIYFLLRSQDKSAFHKIKSDELWHFHAGGSLVIYTLSQKEGLQEHRLGLQFEKGERPQIVIPAFTWFGALVEAQESYCLASCTVAPGFDFHDFEMADKTMLLNEFPSYENIIHRLC